MELIINNLSVIYEKLLQENNIVLFENKIDYLKIMDFTMVMTPYNILMFKKEKKIKPPKISKRFDCIYIPEISIKDYMLRIYNYSKCNNVCSLSSYINLKILIDKGIIKLTIYNIHRLLLISIMIFSKFYDDDYYSNLYWSRIGGISLEDLNNLEIEYLNLLDYNININTEKYEKYNTLFFKN